jgi:DHA3 family macrolide efflux protein-like MFS transporter
MSEQSSSPPKTYNLRAFFILWIGQALSLLGSQLVQFALIWYLTRETGSGTVLALATLMGMLPMIVLGPFAGALVDRWSRRWVMFVADTVVALATLVLALLFAANLASIPAIYAILFIRSLGGAFHRPAMTASTTLMIPPEHLTRISGLNQMLNGGLNIIAAPLGALLVEFLAIEYILYIDVVTALFAIVPLLFIAVPQPAIALEAAVGAKALVRSVRKDFLAGFNYIWAHYGLRKIAVMALLINFVFAPAGSLLPLLITEHYGGGAIEFGWAEAALGGGVILGGLLLGVWGGFQRRLVTTMVGLVGMGLGALFLGALPPTLFVVALVAALFLGIFVPITNGPVHATLQVTVTPEMQGRAFTLLGSLAMAMSPVGLLVAGPLSDIFGVQVFYIAAGFICILMAGVGLADKQLINLDQQGAVAKTMEPEAIAG